MRQAIPGNSMVARWMVGILIALSVAGLVAAACFLLINGGMAASKKELGVAIFLAALPAMLYAGARRPFIFPFCLYIIVAPFDTLLQINHGIGTVTKLIALGVGAAFVFWLIRHRRIVKLSSPAFVWLSLLIWMSLSVFWAIDPVSAVTKLTTYTLLIVLYLATSLMPPTLSDYKMVLGAVLACGVVGAAVSVYLYKTGAFVQHANFQGVLSSRLLVQFSGEKLGPDEFSAALLLPAAVTLTLALQRQWSLAKMGLIFIFVLIVGGIFVNDSRGAILALGVLIGYMILRSRFRSQLIPFSVLGLGASLLMPTSPWARFANAEQSGGSGRVSIWKVGWEAFRHHWLTGAGVGNFPLAYNKSFINVYQSYYANWSRAPHSIAVEYAVELGIIGLALLLAGWYVQVRSLQLIHRSSPLYDIRIGLEGAILATFVAGLFVGIMADKFTWILFVVVAITRSLALSTTPSGQEPVVSKDRFALTRRNDPDSKEPVHA